MLFRFVSILGALAFSLSSVSCSSANKNAVKTETPEPVAAAQPQAPAPVYSSELWDSTKLKNLEIAHESYLRSLDLAAKGEDELSALFLQHAFEADSNNRYLAFAVAEHLDGAGDPAGALNLAARAKTMKGPETSSEDALLGRLYAQAGTMDSARVYYKKAIDASDQNLEAAYEYSLLLEVIRDYKELSRVYDILLPQLNYPRSMLDRQILLLQQAGKDSSLLALLSAAYDALGEPGYLKSHMQLLAQNGQDSAAIEDARELLSETPDDSLTLKSLVQLLSKNQRSGEALDTLNEYHRRNPKSRFILFTLGLQEAAMNLNHDAERHLNKVKEDSLYAGGAYFALSSLALQKGDTAKAIKDLESAYKAEPDTYGSEMAWRYGLSGKYDKAYPILDSLVKSEALLDSMISVRAANEGWSAGKIGKLKTALKEESAKHQFLYGNVLLFNAESIEDKYLSGDSSKRDSARIFRERAEEHFKEAMGDGFNEDNLYFSIGANLLALNRVDDAVVYFKMLFKKNPHHATGLNHLGYTLVDLNRNADELKWGVSLVDTALSIEPDNVAFLDSKGWALYRTGKYEEALAVMDSVESRAANVPGMLTEDTTVYAHLAAICEALHLNDRAIGYYKKMLLIMPKDVSLKKRLKALSSSSATPK